jgi:tetratricopeptide (TPR) repeat protein
MDTSAGMLLQFMLSYLLIFRCSDERANLFKELADALMADHTTSHKLDNIEEAISVYEQVLRLRPSGHEQRAEAASDLGDALFLFCLHHRDDESRAHRSVELLREAVLLRPPEHPLRSRSLHILAKALFFVDYAQGSGVLPALTESILLNREALQLRPFDHPERANSLSNLGAALMEYFRC